MNTPRMTDSTSDGMCGYVEWQDGTRKVRVRWSISDPDGITSQQEANEKAKRLLRMYGRAAGRQANDARRFPEPRGG